MAELKTKKNNASVQGFVSRVEGEEKRADAKKLLKIFREVTKEKPAMWGGSIIGFCSYHYKSERSSQQGEWFRVGFSPRKNYLALYLMSGFEPLKGLLKKLGKHKLSKGCCLYIKKLSDVDEKVLRQVIKAGMKTRDYNG